MDVHTGVSTRTLQSGNEQKALVGVERVDRAIETALVTFSRLEAVAVHICGLRITEVCNDGSAPTRDGVIPQLEAKADILQEAAQRAHDALSRIEALI
jgi:hypothetical protein